ncbi:MAG: 50S ribosomal protein L15 [Candidatus Dormibacteraeota bacterium]|nr:50S ribosomal protein L15 [Candidatus Dormibacteraeota bacterium]
MRIDELKPSRGSRKSRKRVGRGSSAGGGKTAGRGQKGQGARSSWSLPRGFEGGQMPLTQRVPKLRGFYNRFRTEFQVVNVAKLARFEAGTVVDQEGLRKAGLVRRSGAPVKLLAGGSGAIPALTVRVDAASGAAIAAVREAGGEVILPAPAAGEEAADTDS